MKAIQFVVVLAILVCVVGWIFDTNFLILDIILILFIYGLQIAIVIGIIIALLWVFNEIFR
jgi:hypothetical protein